MRSVVQRGLSIVAGWVAAQGLQRDHVLQRLPRNAAVQEPTPARLSLNIT